MQYEIIFYKLLVVYRATGSLCGGCTYKRVDVVACIYSHSMRILQYDILPTNYDKLLFRTSYFIVYILTFPFYQEQKSIQF